MRTLTTCIGLLLLSSTTLAQDWPTYLANPQRTGVTTAKLQLPLQQRWVYSSPIAPRRAWTGPQGRVVEGHDLFDRVKFDDAIDVAVAGRRAYFGSMVDHKVYCLDMVDGHEVWRFFTGAPIRLAPTVSGGRVYVGSDDGYAYCLDAEDGRLVWKLQLGPADEWILGRGEMISRWPVRTGVLVDDDIAYFGAGIFPHENVYMCAVHAASGEIIWRNDNISHQDAGRNDLSPQGYLLATPDRLYVPSGRSRPRSVNRKTGRLGGGAAAELKLSSGAVAGTNGLIIDGQLFTYSLGSQMVGTSTATYVTTGRMVARLDRQKYARINIRRDKLRHELRKNYGQYRDKEIDEETYRNRSAKLREEIGTLEDEGVDWKAPCKANSVVIVAGDLVIVGGKGEVVAFAASSGKQVWIADVDGEAGALAAVPGRLLVGTTTGKIYCFGDGNTETVAGSSDRDAPGNVSSPPEYRAAAESILKQTGITRGYCLIVGSETGRLAHALARHSELKICGVEQDAAKVAAARQLLTSAGLYGHRVTIHQGKLDDISYPSYFANLVVSDTLLTTGRIPAEPARLIRHLKPSGGVVCLGQPGEAIDAAASSANLRAWLQKADLGERGKVGGTGPWVTLTRGPLEGAGNWSHQYAEPGNSANSGDKLVKGGLGILWYGDPGPEMMVNRHQGAVGPLVVDGRLFVQGTHSLMAYDAYNGLSLWEVDNPRAIRTGVFQNRTPGNLAAGGDSVFHMVRKKVYEHDAATGNVNAIHELPPSVDSEKQQWGYVAYRDGLLIGTATARHVIERFRRGRGDPGPAATDTIFAIDVETGQHLWAYQGNSIDFQTIALGAERVFFIDSSVTSEQRAAILRADKSKLEDLKGAARQRAEKRIKSLDVRLAVALDARTGKQIWAEPVDVTDCSEIGIGGGKLTMMYHNDVLLLCGANANGHFWQQFVGGEFARRRLVALHALDGNPLWAKDANYRHRPIIIGDRVIAEPWAFELHTGKQLTRKHPVTGNDEPWSIMRPGHHCGMLSACDNMLMFRSGYTGFYDLAADAGTRHFAGHRLGCWINAIPANGLVVIPEASTGCVCMFSIASTIVMEPRTPRRPWSLYSGVGTLTPVKRLALNFGAPGDRRDSDGKMWLAYPRMVPNPSNETGLDLKLKLDTDFHARGRFVSHDGDASERNAADLAWVASSGALGLTRCAIPLLGKDDPPALYAVRLCFASQPGDRPGSRVFDVVVQGETRLENVDAAADADHGAAMLWKRVDGISVTDKLHIVLKPRTKNSEIGQMPILSGIEVTRIDGGN